MGNRVDSRKGGHLIADRHPDGVSCLVAISTPTAPNVGVRPALLRLALRFWRLPRGRSGYRSVMSAWVVGAPVDRAAMAWRPVGLVAAVAGLLLLVTARAYGYHRDELYFRLLGQQPSWGYVDQPPATPMLARLTVEVLGDHPWALRLPGAVILAATAILTAMLARELGGGRGPQLLAAASSLTCSR
jgi:hypothetical protein